MENMKTGTVLKGFLAFIILVHWSSVLYGMAAALGAQNLKQVATFWISSVMPKNRDPYSTQLGKDIIAGKYKNWDSLPLTQKSLEEEVDKQLKELAKITQLVPAGGPAVGVELSTAIKELAKGSKAQKVQALAQVVAGAGSQGAAVLNAIKETNVANDKLDLYRKAVIAAANAAIS